MDYFSHENATVIEPPTRWRMLDLRELWAFRELFWVLIERDIKVRYKQTVLGASWIMLRPLTTAVIFSLVFGRLVKVPSDGYPYPVFVYAALVPWMFFADAVGRSGNSLVNSSQLISKVYFPRLIIPLAAVGAGLLDLAISTCVLVGLMWYFGVGVSWGLVWAPLLFLAVAVAAFAFGCALSALTVAYRDFAAVTPFLIQIWMYITPVIYPSSMFPDRWRGLASVNPLWGIVEVFRSAVLGSPFDPWSLGFSLLGTTVVLAAGIVYFEKVERRFADII